MNETQLENLGAFTGAYVFIIIILLFKYNTYNILIPMLAYGVSIHFLNSNKRKYRKTGKGA